MHFTRRTAMGAAAAVLSGAAAQAQSGYPTKPIRIIVTYPPGGVNDIVTREIAKPLEQILRQVVAVENVAGSGGNVGMIQVAKSDADGHTLMLGTSAMLGVNPVLYPRSGIDPLRDLTAIGTIGQAPNVLSVNPQRLDVKSVAELVAAAKQKGGLLYGSVGNGSSSHLSTELLLQGTGMQAEHVPYKGSSFAVAALLNKEVDFIHDTTASSAKHIQAGAFRALAVTTATRSSALPDVPTMQEAGIAGYNLGVWFAIFAPSGTPKPVVDRLKEALSQAMSEDTKKKLRDLYVDPLVVPAAELQGWIESEQKRWMGLARSVKLSSD